MYTNAGIRPTYTPSNRHATSSSDPPGQISQSYSYAPSHYTRLSDGYVFPSTASTSSRVAVPRHGPARTTIYAPPSSFHSHLHSVSSSVSSLTTTTTTTAPTTHQYKIGPSSSASSLISTSQSRPSLSLSVDGTNYPQSTKSELARSESTVLNGMASSNTPSRRTTPSSVSINVKRLMSKPTAIPSRSNSVLSFTAAKQSVGDNASDVDDSEEEDYRSHSLDILRKCKRRSRSVDIMMTAGKSNPAPVFADQGRMSMKMVQPNPALLSSPTRDRYETSATLPPPSSYISPTHSHHSGVLRSPSTPGTARPYGNPSWHEIGNKEGEEEDTSRSQTKASPNSADPGPLPLSSCYETPRPLSNSTFTTSPVTPASAIALAWTEQQKRLVQNGNRNDVNGNAPAHGSTSASSIVTSTLHGPVPKQASRSQSLPASSPPLPPPSSSNTIDHHHHNWDVYSNSNPRFASHNSTTTFDVQRKINSGTGTLNEKKNIMSNITGDQDDPLMSWVLAEQALTPVTARAPTDTMFSSSSRDYNRDGGGASVGSVSVSTHVRELSRRLTGALVGRKDKGREQFYMVHNHANSNHIAAELRPITMPSVEPVVVSKAPIPTLIQSLTLFQEAHDQQERLGGGRVKTDGRDDGLKSLVSRHITSHTTSSSTGTGPARVEPSGYESLPIIPPLPIIGSTFSTVNDNQMPFRPSLSINSTESRQSPPQSVLSPSLSPRTNVPPPRSNTPNTLKKKSRGSLRKKSSTSAFVPVGINPGSEDAHMIMTTSMTSTSISTTIATAHANTPTTPLEEDGSAAGKLRGLVRKLSSGALRKSVGGGNGNGTEKSNRTSSSHISSSSSSSFFSPGPGSGSNNGHGVAEEFIPPVPPLPKDFELITDHEAYLAERAKRRERRERIGDSDNDSVAHSSSNLTPQRLGTASAGSQKSSRRSSLVRSTTLPPPPSHGQSEPTLASISHTHTYLDPLQKPLRRAGTEPIPIEHFSLQSTSTNSIPLAANQPAKYAFPKRPKPKQELSSSVGSTSYSVSGTDHHGGTGYRSSAPPSPASPDMRILSHGNVNNDDMVSVESHEMGSSVSHSQSMLGQPIMPAKELYRLGEDEASALKARQVPAVLRKKQSLSKVTTSEPVSSQRDAEKMSPPPKISPTLMAPLGVPPPRPPRRAPKPKASTSTPSTTPSSPTTATTTDRLRPSHNRHQRSISSPPPMSPASPNLPIFSNSSAVNAIPLSKRSRSMEGERREITQALGLQPPIPVDQPSPVLHPLRKSKSQTSLKGKRKLPPLLLAPTSKSNVPSAQCSPSPGEEHHPIVRTPSSGGGALGRVKSLISSAGRTPNSASSGSGSPFSPPSTGGRRSTSRSRTMSKDRYLTDGETPPPVPFTSTAVGFGQSPLSPRGRSAVSAGRLTESEREDMWNALLVKSERAGGTLTIGNAGLASDRASVLLAESISLNGD